MMSLTRRFHLMVVLPLVALSVTVAVLTAIGLRTDATQLDQVQASHSLAVEALNLTLIQDGASKAMLLDPSRIGELSEDKLEAHDRHLLILGQLEDRLVDPEAQALLAELAALNDEVLQPAFTRILEEMFVDPAAARAIYFRDYEPERRRYEETIDALTRRVSALELAESRAISRKNLEFFLLIVGVLMAGIALIAITIQILASRVEATQESLTSLLRGMEEGLFFFGRDGAIAPARSQALSEILPGSEGCPTLHALMERFGGCDAESVALCLSLLWPEEEDFFSMFESTVSFLPSQLTLHPAEGEERVVELAYRAHYDAAGALDRVYVTARDVTASLKAQRQAATQRARVERITRAAANPDDFEGFVKEMDRLVQAIGGAMETLTLGDRGSLSELRRHLHTAKGLLGTFDFTDLARRIHGIEELLGPDGPADPFDLGREWVSTHALWAAEVQDVFKVLGRRASKGTMQVSIPRLVDMARAAAAEGDERWLARVEALVRLPLAAALSRHETYVRGLAERRAELEVRLDFDPHSAEVSRAEAQAVDGVLGHLLRNAADHGIEPPEDREAAGKPREGCITVGVQRLDGGGLRWTVEDDGRGIDGDRLAAKMVAAGRWTEAQRATATETDKQALIFQPSLSARDEVGATSGRGVGMDAVAQQIADMGGQIHLHSAAGLGTRLTFEVPGQGLEALAA